MPLWAFLSILAAAFLMLAAIVLVDRWSERRDLRAADRRARQRRGLEPPPIDLPDHAADLAASSPVRTLPWPVPGVTANRRGRIGP